MSRPRRRRRLRRSLSVVYSAQLEALSQLLYRFDPIGLASLGVSTDEYEPEAETILPRLGSCQTAGQVQTVLHEEFCRWFDKSGVAGTRDNYAALSVAVWEWWGRQPGSPDPRTRELLPKELLSFTGINTAEWAAAVAYLRRRLRTAQRAEIARSIRTMGLDWASAHHFPFGMHIRNLLRGGGYDEGRLGINDLDSAWVHLLVEAIAPELEKEGHPEDS